MSICSRHRVPRADCDLCQRNPEDLFGKENWARMKAEAKAAGEHKCQCGFTYYKTTNACPKCGTKLPE